MDLKDMIRERGLKQKWVAAQIDVLPPQFSRMVNGEVPFPRDKVTSLARVLRYTVAMVNEAVILTATPTHARPGAAEER